MPRPQRSLFKRLRHHVMVWLALLIAWLGALAPTLSHALAWAGGSAPPLVEICTSNGPRWVALKVSTDAPDAPVSLVHPEHCPFCLHSTDRVAPPPHVPGADFGAPGDPVAPTPGSASVGGSPLAPVPPPRGPPIA